VLRNLPAILFVMALVLSASTNGHGTLVERLLAWVLLLPIGITGLWAGISHVFFPATAAAHIGRQLSPFQFEVGMADLAIGVTACVSFLARPFIQGCGGFRGIDIPDGRCYRTHPRYGSRGQFRTGERRLTILHGRHLPRARYNTAYYGNARTWRRLVETEGTKGEGKMKEEPASRLPRFVVRKGRVEGSWMVWNRKIQRPAKMQQGVAARLTEGRARGISDQLMRAHEGLKPLK
jgi:hypothetical protein